MTLSSVTLLFLVLALPGDADDIVARIDGDALTTDELYRFVAREYADGDRASLLLDQMIQETLVRTLARRAGLRATDEQIQERFRQLEAETRNRSGGEVDLDKVLAERGISRGEFLESLATTFLAEQLARRAFGIAPGQPIPYQKTNLWLRERMRAATIVRTGLPDGVLVRVEGTAIREADFGRRYVRDLSSRERRALLSEFVDSFLIEREARRAGVELTFREARDALAKRRDALAEDPRLAGADLDDLLERSGADLDRLARSARVRNRLLMAKMVDRDLGPGGLEEYWRRHRAEIDAEIGPRVRLRGVFLRAGPPGARKAGFVPRLYEDAEKELAALRRRVTAGDADLAREAAARSEHASRTRQGDLGWRTRSDGELGELVSNLLERGPLEPGLPEPVRTSKGVWLVEILEVEPPPPFEKIRPLVRRRAASEIYRRLKESSEIVLHPEAIEGEADAHR